MLSTTTHLTTDIFAMPLLWVLPLGLYLLSFVIAFSTAERLTMIVPFMAPPVLLGVGGLSLLSSGGGSMLIEHASLVMLFVVSTAIGRAHVCTPVTTAHILSRLLLEIKIHK